MDGVVISSSDHSRFYQDDTHSLHITNAAVADSATFKCHVQAELDEAEAIAKLLVKGDKLLSIVFLMKVLLFQQYL